MLLKMWSSSARRTNRIAIAPIALPSWTKVLRLGPVPKVSLTELMEVMKACKTEWHWFLFSKEIDWTVKNKLILGSTEEI